VKNVGANVVMNVVMNVVTNVVTASLQCFFYTLYNGKFTVTTFRNGFSRFLNCPEYFARANSTPKMPDFGFREKGKLRQFYS
jgi:hypothetical protein